MRRWAALGWVLVAAALLGLAGRAAAPAMGAGTLELRVIAASNRPEDQAVKLQVRDAVLALLAPGMARETDGAGARTYAAERLPDVQRVAAAVAGRAGQGVRVHLGNEVFPLRHIGLLTFAAGPAPALVITLGAGQGHNWFTVLFPPLALVTVDGNLVAVGPQGASEPVRDLTATERRALLAWVAGQTGLGVDPRVQAAGADSPAGAQVQVRFALWDLLSGIPWGGVRQSVAAWLGLSDGGAGA